MGVDIVAITKHNLTVQEIFELPDRINTWNEIHEFHKSHNNDKSDSIDAKWDAGIIEVTTEVIEKEWDAWVTNQTVQAYPKIYCSFADFKVNRHTINICPSWMHKYGNLYDFSTREYVMKLIRKIAKKLGAERVIYCADSACSTYILEEHSNMGWEFEKIEKFGLNEFGGIPKDLTKAVYNYFFIDDLKLNIDDYNNEKYIFNRSNEEYFLEQKFGERFIIKRPME